jgi:hypothetical protein
VGLDNRSHRDLNTGVSIVTHTPEGMGHYVVPGVQLCMIKGDAKEVTKDEVVQKTSLNHTLSWLDRTHQTLPCLNWSSYRNPLEGGRDATPYQWYGGTLPSRLLHRDYVAQKHDPTDDTIRTMRPRSMRPNST